jgi:hypothetical protein
MLIQFTVTEANGGPTMDDLPPEMYTVPVGNVMMPVTAVHVRPFPHISRLLAANNTITMHTQVLALDSTYRDAAELLEATEASHYGSDNHASNGIYVEVGSVTRRAPARPAVVSPEGVEDAVIGEYSALLSGYRATYDATTFELEENAPLSPSKPVARRRYYAPTVIPVVQSRESMVIVGAVLRKDIKESLNRIRKLNELAQAAPVSTVVPVPTLRGR